MDELPIAECYRLLELPPGSPPAAVRDAYRDLSRVWHPDRFAADPELLGRANAQQQKLNAAYRRLTRAFETGELAEPAPAEWPAQPAAGGPPAAARRDPGAFSSQPANAPKPAASRPRTVEWVRAHPYAATASGIVAVLGMLALVVAALRSSGVVRSADGERIAASTTSVGGAHACAAGPEGAVCWGQNDAGQLGLDGLSVSSRALPVTLPRDPIDVAAGLAHTCALLEDGTIGCWGGNFAGQLGDRSLADRATAARVAGGATYRSVSSLGRHTCALTRAGSVHCWGDDTDGQLGTGAPVAACRLDELRFHCSDRPESVGHPAAWSAVSAGGGHTCAVDDAGVTYCWGSNRYGQLGSPSDDTCAGPGGRQPCSRSPLRIDGIGGQVRAVTAGGSHSCALDAAGAAWCWGRNDFGQAGGYDTIVPVPRRLSAPAPFRQIAAGGYHTCGLTAGGAVYCWGRDESGELRGVAGERCGDVRCSRRPVLVQRRGIRQVDAGFGRTCTVLEDGTVRCWGAGDAFVAATPADPRPAAVGAGRRWREAAWVVGSAHRFIRRFVPEALRDVG